MRLAGGAERGRKKEEVPAKAPEAVRPRASAVRMGVGVGMVEEFVNMFTLAEFRLGQQFTPVSHAYFSTKT